MSRTIVGELFRTDRNGVILEDLSDPAWAGTVEYSASRSGSTPLIGRCTFDRADVLAPMQDFVSPFLTLIDEDGTKIGPRRIGVYCVTLPSELHTNATAKPSYELRDLTELLGRGGSSEPYEIPSGTNIVTALTAIAAEVGLTRVNFPNSTRTTGRDRIFPAGTPYLEMMNKLCEAVGWFPIWMGLDGRLTTKPQQRLSETTPITTITAEHPAAVGLQTPVVRVTPTDPAAIANIVVVTKERSDEDPLEAVLVNDDPASPTSTANIGPIVYGGGPYEATDAETQADVDAIADRLFDQMRSYERTVELGLEPDPALLGMWRTLDLDIATVAGANLRGRYWINGWTCGFTPRDAVMTFVLNRLVRFGRGEDA